MSEDLENGPLYQEILKALAESGEALTCHDILDYSRVKTLSESNAQLVSNYLGNLWRKGLVRRVPASYAKNKTHKARYAYQTLERRPEITAANAADAVEVFVDRPQVRVSRAGKTISVITPHATITIDLT